MTSKWIPETEETEESKKYAISAHVALEDSDKEAWGMVRDTEGNLLWKPGDGPLVGKWSRSPHDGLIHLSLTTPIEALRDRAIQAFNEYAEKRRETVSATKKRTPRAPKAAPEPSEDQTKIDGLRKLLRK